MAVPPVVDLSNWQQQLDQISERLNPGEINKPDAAALHEQWRTEWTQQSEQLSDRLEILNRKLEELTAEKVSPALRVMSGPGCH